MAFRNLFIENPAHISVRSGQLVIRTDTEHTVPVEDVSSVMLESMQCTMTAAALSLLGQCGCSLFICDEKHLPCSILLPFSQHSRSLSVLRDQTGASEPLKKRLWQSIVRKKIVNQAACLHLLGKKAPAERLVAMAGNVRSGDTGNVEASSAQLYFRELFGPGFTRGADNGINAGLNYGYAILRGCIARTLASYGFLPTLGIHHQSTLNQFNLADDLIEPFRPVIDLLVIQYIRVEDPLSPSHKQMLFNSLNLDVLSGEQHHSVSYAIERTVQSLAASLASGKAEILLPDLLPTKQHVYE